VQVVPHVTDAIQNWIERVAKLPVDPRHPNVEPDVCMIEFGGTVGDIESMVFLEALRQLRYRCGGDNVCHVHVSLVPVVGAVGEPKSKPTQHGVAALRAVGLSPDIIICRSTQALTRSVISKISMFCMLPSSNVISVHDVSNIYKVPVLLLEQRVASLVLNSLKINRMPAEDLPQWREMGEKVENPGHGHVTIAIVGKYTGLSDSYLSVTKSINHAGIALDMKVRKQHLHHGSRSNILSGDDWCLVPCFFFFRSGLIRDLLDPRPHRGRHRTEPRPPVCSLLGRARWYRLPPR
jgi:CTP synthase